MKLRISKVIVTAAMLVVFSGASSLVAAQNANANRKPTVKGEMKKSGKEVSNAGKGLGRNVKHGHVVRGTKHFGKHVGRAAKHFGKGSKTAAKKTGAAVKNTAKP